MIGKINLERATSHKVVDTWAGKYFLPTSWEEPRDFSVKGGGATVIPREDSGFKFFEESMGVSVVSDGGDFTEDRAAFKAGTTLSGFIKNHHGGDYFVCAHQIINVPAAAPASAPSSHAAAPNVIPPFNQPASCKD